MQRRVVMNSKTPSDAISRIRSSGVSVCVSISGCGSAGDRGGSRARRPAGSRGSRGSRQVEAAEAAGSGPRREPPACQRSAIASAKRPGSPDRECRNGCARARRKRAAQPVGGVTRDDVMVGSKRDGLGARRGVRRDARTPCGDASRPPRRTRTAHERTSRCRRPIVAVVALIAVAPAGRRPTGNAKRKTAARRLSLAPTSENTPIASAARSPIERVNAVPGPSPLLSHSRGGSPSSSTSSSTAASRTKPNATGGGRGDAGGEWSGAGVVQRRRRSLAAAAALARVRQRMCRGQREWKSRARPKRASAWFLFNSSRHLRVLPPPPPSPPRGARRTTTTSSPSVQLQFSWIGLSPSRCSRPCRRRRRHRRRHARHRRRESSSDGGNGRHGRRGRGQRQGRSGGCQHGTRQRPRRSRTYSTMNSGGRITPSSTFTLILPL